MKTKNKEPKRTTPVDGIYEAFSPGLFTYGQVWDAIADGYISGDGAVYVGDDVWILPDGSYVGDDELDD